LCILCDAGGGNAARELAGLLRERGDLDGLRALAEVGDQDVAEQLATLMADQRRGEEVASIRFQPRRINRLQARALCLEPLRHHNDDWQL
jgi:hypothetical protein